MIDCAVMLLDSLGYEVCSSPDAIVIVRVERRLDERGDYLIGKLLQKVQHSPKTKIGNFPDIIHPGLSNSQ
jgi:hypothetical protein